LVGQSVSLARVILVKLYSSSRCTYRRVRIRVVFGSLSSTKAHLETYVSLFSSVVKTVVEYTQWKQSVNTERTSSQIWDLPSELYSTWWKNAGLERSLYNIMAAGGVFRQQRHRFAGFLRLFFDGWKQPNLERVSQPTRSCRLCRRLHLPTSSPFRPTKTDDSQIPPPHVSPDRSGFVSNSIGTCKTEITRSFVLTFSLGFLELRQYYRRI